MGVAADQILDQMAYLVDELEAQSSVLGVIPEVVWDARPPSDPVTLREMYGAMLQRECGEYRRAVGLDAVDAPEVSEPAQVLEAISGVRAATVEALRGRELTSLDLDACYAITQNDADTLRAVGIRLHETSMGAPRVRQL